MIIFIDIAGILLIALSAMHAFLPRYFGWHEELTGISSLTRQIFLVHHFFIALTVGLMGVLTLLRGQELLATRLGQEVSLGLSFFWSVRLLFQFFVYSPSHWRGKRFETIIHILFTALWFYLAVIYLLAGNFFNGA